MNNELTVNAVPDEESKEVLVFETGVEIDAKEDMNGTTGHGNLQYNYEDLDLFLVLFLITTTEGAENPITLNESNARQIGVGQLQTKYQAYV